MLNIRFDDIFKWQMNPDNAYTRGISRVFCNGLNVLSFYETSKTELFSNN